MRSLLRGAVCAAALVACGPERDASWIDSTPTGAIDGEVLIDADLTAEEAASFGLELVDYDKGVGFGLYRIVDGRPADELHGALSQVFPGVRVERNMLRFITSNDPEYRRQWNLDMVRAEEAWQFTRGEGITVAVIDTGVHGLGADAPIHLLQGYDFVDDDADADDPNGHGTHVAGTIAQATDNGIGVAGLAPEVAVLPVRVINANGGGSAYNIARGIVWAVDNGADVINLSIGSANGMGAEMQAIEYAIAEGVVVVAASGNDGDGQLLFPAAYNGVIAVGAVNAVGELAPYSNYGYGLDLVAPGGATLSDDDGDGFPDGILQEGIQANGQSGLVYLQGTSMAAPHVSAAAALLLAAGAPAAQVESRLKGTAVDVGEPGFDERSGFGLIDPAAALANLVPPVTPAPDPQQPDPQADPQQPDPQQPDPLPPVDPAEGLTNIDIDRFGSLLTVRWTTDVPATSHVQFLGYGLVGEDDLTTNHELNLTVDFWETYFVHLQSTDAAGATMVSELEVVFPFE